MVPKTTFSKALCGDIKGYPFCELVASLLYLLWTRPDVSFAVKELSRWMSNPGPAMVTAGKRVLRYLRGTMDLQLLYHAKPFFGGISKSVNFPDDTPVWAYSDAAWADQHDRKSTGGMFLFFNGSAIMWWCRTLQTVALSSQDSEFMTLSDSSRELVFLQNLLCSVGYLTKDVSAQLFGDNRGSITLANTPGDHQKSKHLDVRYFYVRQKIDDGRLEVKWVPTTHQLADLLTKALPDKQHKLLTFVVMGHQQIDATFTAQFAPLHFE